MHITVRERIRLRQFRYNALESWKVPTLMAILPVLLQVALILFLVGLCLMLNNLDKTVAKVFIAFTGIALSAYSAITVLPIAFRRCPYKNPVARGIIKVAKFTAGVIVLIVFTLNGLAWIAWILVSALWACVFRTGTEWWRASVSSGYRRFASISSLIPKIENRRAESGGHEYWTARDLAYMACAHHLDRDALVWAPSGVPQAELPRLDRCLQDIPSHERKRCVGAWVAQTLNVATGALDDGASMFCSPFDSFTFKKMDRVFSDRFREALLREVTDVLEEKDGVPFYEASFLVMLRHIAKAGVADEGFMNRYARRIMNIRTAQTIEVEDLTAWHRLPTACIFDLSIHLQYRFSEEGTLGLV